MRGGESLEARFSFLFDANTPADEVASTSASNKAFPQKEDSTSSESQSAVVSSRSAGDKLAETPATKLTPKQDYAIELLADFENTMTQEQMAKAIGICRRTILDWSKRIPGWHEEIARRVRHKKDRLEVISIRALARVMRTGAEAPVVSAARTALQYCGALKTEGQPVNVNQVTNVAVGSFADAVTRHRRERGLLSGRPEQS